MRWVIAEYVPGEETRKKILGAADRSRPFTVFPAVMRKTKPAFVLVVISGSVVTFYYAVEALDEQDVR